MQRSWLLLQEEQNKLSNIYLSDAVYALEMIHTLVFSPINSLLPKKLFSVEWEIYLMNNEVAHSLVNTLDDYLRDIEVYLDNEFLFKKLIDLLITKTVVFYLSQLLRKAKQQSVIPTRKKVFENTKRACNRFSDDIEIFKKFFVRYAGQIKALHPTIKREFDPLLAIKGFIFTLQNYPLQNDMTEREMQEFAAIFYNMTGTINLTRKISCDLCLIFAPNKAKLVNKSITAIKDELTSVKPHRMFPSNNNKNQSQMFQYTKMFSSLYALENEVSINLEKTDHRKNNWDNGRLTRLRKSIGEKTKKVGGETIAGVKGKAINETNHATRRISNHTRQVESRFYWLNEYSAADCILGRAKKVGSVVAGCCEGCKR